MVNLGLAVQERLSSSIHETFKNLLQGILQANINDVLLDVGGGTGVLGNYFSDICKEVWVLDPEAKKLRFGRERRKNVNFINASAYQIPFVNGSFSKATAIVSFHHFPDQDAALQEIKRVLKPDGQLALLEFDPTTIRGKVVNFFENKLGKKNCRFYTPVELKEKVSILGYGEINTLKAPVGYLLTAVNSCS